MFDKVIETSIEKLERMECSKKCQAKSIRTCGRVPQGIKSQLKSPPKNTFFSNRLLVSDAIQWSALITTIHPHNSINYTPPAIPYSHQNLMLPEASLRRSEMAYRSGCHCLCLTTSFAIGVERVFLADRAEVQFDGLRAKLCQLPPILRFEDRFVGLNERHEEGIFAILERLLADVKIEVAD
jgi:hypothetical protein